MKYTGMPQGMWLLYKRSFQRNLISVLGSEPEKARKTTRKAAGEYRKIIAKLPGFEKGDRFRMNLVNCAVLIAFLLHMDEKPSVEKLTEYYATSMMTLPTRVFCRIGGIGKFSKKDIVSMKKTAAFRAADRNPYSWNMEYIPYPDGSGYEARFSKCGICTLMKEYGLYDLTPAMCHLDYDMTEAGGASEFIREYTLAGGGPYCDCGYKKRMGGSI
ncbi:MAG: L-2-amino-thiazoline-4-carboxylic acid hydrolase [Clostridia bacterium]|nr:L-2-amino-thiazoline-4-carboxylic acid hydrolase [Clostridia bacterium]